MNKNKREYTDVEFDVVFWRDWYLYRVENTGHSRRNPYNHKGTTMNEKLAKAKNYVQAHKEAIKATTITLAITVPVIVLQNRGIKDLNAFLESKDLVTEYYEVYSADAWLKTRSLVPPYTRLLVFAGKTRLLIEEVNPIKEH